MSKKVHMASATQRSGTINIVYLNTDWKQSRHDTPESRSRNKRKLQETIESIAASMHPDILCMCEVGVASALMTEQQLEDMRSEAVSKHALEDALVVHRVGTIYPGDDIVLVAAFSAHRKEALAACREMMETLKSTAPFWKKETLADGERWVERNTPG